MDVWVGTHVDHFESRARRYLSMDRALGQVTVFFGAAAWTNQVLARLAQHAPLCRCSMPTIELLETLGRALEVINRGMMPMLANSRPRAVRETDRHIVRTEQWAAERFLANLRGQDPDRFDMSIHEINRVLNRRWSPMWRMCPQLFGFMRVLTMVRQSLDVPLSFANQQHRETIGLSLIASLRQRQLPLLSGRQGSAPRLTASAPG